LAAQLHLALPDEPGPEPDEPPVARRTRAKPERTSAGWQERLRPVLVGFAAVAVAAGAIAAGYRFDSFLAGNRAFFLSPAGLEMTGTRYTPPAAIRSVFREDFGRSIYLLPVSARRQALLGIDWVKEVVVSRRWPNRVVVRIVERVPAAFVLLPGEGPALVDDQGVILRPPPTRFDLPVVRGLDRRQPAQARRARMRQVVQFLREVQAHTPDISEIDASDPQRLAIMQQVGGRTVRLVLGDRNYRPRLERFLRNYPEINQRLPGATVFDLRLDDRITASGMPPAESARPPRARGAKVGN
jgi:cell division protein FtsQ